MVRVVTTVEEIVAELNAGNGVAIDHNKSTPDEVKDMQEAARKQMLSGKRVSAYPSNTNEILIARHAHKEP